MIYINEMGCYTWEAEDRDAVYEAMASLHEQLAEEGYSDEEIAAHANSMLERMRLKQLH
jgi:hypothetical protein